MSVKVQFFKCGLCAAFYLVVCLVLIKRSFNLKEEPIGNRTATERRVQTAGVSIQDRIIKKNVESEVEMLRMDELKGEAIDLQESATLLKLVSSVCAKYNLRTPLVKRHFLYNAKHRSLYCWIRKVASTSFTKLFSDMSNRRVSHNFYKDRIEDNSRYTAQSWLYARQIFYLSRPELFRPNVTGDSVLQRVFLTNRRLKMVPSFREFLEWLLKQPPGHDDDHWAQYYTHCAVCDTSYNFILKLDEYTFGEINYVLSKLKLDKSKVYLPKLQRTRAGITDFDVTCKYFHNLTTDMVLRLYERYKVDFEMYNYKIDKYLPCAKRKN